MPEEDGCRTATQSLTGAIGVHCAFSDDHLSCPVWTWFAEIEIAAAHLEDISITQQETTVIVKVNGVAIHIDDRCARTAAQTLAVKLENAAKQNAAVVITVLSDVESTASFKGHPLIDNKITRCPRDTSRTDVQCGPTAHDGPIQEGIVSAKGIYHRVVRDHRGWCPTQCPFFDVQ